MPPNPDSPIRFPFRQGPSEIYGTLHRPVAKVYLRTTRLTWLPHYMFVDSGADYTLLLPLDRVPGRGEPLLLKAVQDQNLREGGTVSRIR